MGTVNFSVPDDVNDVFNAAFAGQNKSAIIVELMREAAARAEAHARSRRAAARILKRRAQAPVVAETQIRAAREAGRS